MAENTEQPKPKMTLTKRGEKVKRAVMAAAVALPTGITVNEATHGGVTNVVKEIANFNRNGEEIASTDTSFTLISFQKSFDSLDVIAPITRMKPNAQLGAAFDVVKLEEQGFNIKNIENVKLELGDEYDAPEGEFQQEKAKEIGKMLQEYFGIEPDLASKYWNFEGGLYHEHYGYWLKGTVINPKTGEAMTLHFTPNFAKPLTPPTQPSE